MIEYTIELNTSNPPNLVLHPQNHLQRNTLLDSYTQTHPAPTGITKKRKPMTKQFLYTCLLFTGASALNASQATQSHERNLSTESSRTRETRVCTTEPVTVNVFFGNTGLSMHYHENRKTNTYALHVLRSSQSAAAATAPTVTPVRETQSDPISRAQSTSPIAEQTQSAQSTSSIASTSALATSSSSMMGVSTSPVVATSSQARDEYLRSWKERVSKIQHPNRLDKKRDSNLVPLKLACQAACFLASKDQQKQREAISLLERATCSSIDDTRILLAYCFALGVGTRKDQAAAEKLLLSCKDREEAQLQFAYLRDKVKLGL